MYALEEINLTQNLRNFELSQSSFLYLRLLVFLLFLCPNTMDILGEELNLSVEDFYLFTNA